MSIIVATLIFCVTLSLSCVDCDATLDRKSRPIHLQKFSWKCVKGGRCVRNGELNGGSMNSGWKPTNLTSVFTLRTSVFLASSYYAEGIDTEVKYGCSWMLDGLVSSHPCVNPIWQSPSLHSVVQWNSAL